MVETFTAEQLFEACVPLGNAVVGRSVKAKACRMVMVEGETIERAAHVCGTTTESLRSWLAEVRARMAAARHAAEETPQTWGVAQAPSCIRAAMEVVGVGSAAFNGRGRHHDVVLARELAAKLMRKHTLLSFPEIAVEMNRPNHSSIITMVRRVERMWDELVVVAGTATTRRDLFELAEEYVERDRQRQERAAGQALDRVRGPDDRGGRSRMDQPPRYRGIADCSQRAVRMGERPLAGGSGGGYEVEAG